MNPVTDDAVHYIHLTAVLSARRRVPTLTEKPHLHFEINAMRIATWRIVVDKALCIFRTLTSTIITELATAFGQSVNYNECNQ